MTRRGGRWDLLGHGEDPVPADEWDVDSSARLFEQRADELELAHGTLSRLSRLEGWRGEAGEAFAENADDTVRDLDRAQRRYADAGRALRRFAGAVGNARSETQAALDDAVRADAQQQANDPDALHGLVDPAPEQLAAARAEADRHRDAVDDLSVARTRLENALADLEAAARTCAGELDAASERFADTFWDDRKGDLRSISGFLAAACEVLEWVALGLAAIGLALALLVSSPFWAVVGLVVLALGVLTAALLLLSRAALAFSESGEATWADVAWDAVGLVTSLVGGRAALRAFREVPDLLRSAAAVGRGAVDDAARLALPQHGRNALNIADDSNNLRVWAQGRWDELARPGREALDRAAGLGAGWGERLRVLDLGAATDLNRIRALQDLAHPGTTGLLDEALRLQLDSVRWNLLNTGLSVDGGLDQLDLSLSGVAKDVAEDVAEDVVEDVVEDIQQSHWRLTVVGS